jgi:hypothetical protein
VQRLALLLKERIPLKWQVKAQELMDQQGLGVKYVNESSYVTAIAANTAAKKMPQQWITCVRFPRAAQMNQITLSQRVLVAIIRKMTR